MSEDNITAAVNELVKGPSFSSNLLTDFVSDVALLDNQRSQMGR